MKTKGDGFSTTFNKGFKFTHNGVTISVQFGPGNYCANRDFADVTFDGPMKQQVWESPDAEIAIWDAEGVWITKKVVLEVLKVGLPDDVMGWVTPEQVARLISWMWRRKGDQK